MLVELASFSEEDFDVRAWVNGACKTRHPDEPVDKYLSEIETKLQLLAEDIAAGLEETSSHALLRLPRAIREVHRLKDDALSLRGTVGGLLRRLEKAEGKSAQSVSRLAQIDGVKQRMATARDTLQDAAGLAQLSASVEEVFASGDLPRVAETLGQMRRCLAVVGQVPEFTAVKLQLVSLEDRLETMVQPRLSEALSARKVDAVQALRDILLMIGRYSSLEQQYTRVRVKPLKKVWDELDSSAKALKASGNHHLAEVGNEGSGMAGVAEGSILDWLPRFYDEVLLFFEQEVKWCSTTFPEEHVRLLPKLLMEVMMTISQSFTARIDALVDEIARSGSNASGAAGTTKGGVGMDGVGGSGVQTDQNRGEGGAGRGGRGGLTKLSVLIFAHGLTSSFTKNVQHLLASVGIEPGDMGRVLRAVFYPYESAKQRYGELEREQLLAELGSVDLRGAVVRGVGARGVELSETVQRMEASVPNVIISLEGGIERCVLFTGGSEAEGLLRALEDTMLTYLVSLNEVLRTIRVVSGVAPSALDKASRNPQTDNSPDTSEAGIGRKAADGRKEGASGETEVSGGEEWAVVQGALQLLTVADTLARRVAVFEASLRTSLASLSSKLLGVQEPSTLQQQDDTSLLTLTSPRDSKWDAAGGVVMEVSALRLQDAPEKAKRLGALLEQAKDPRFHALPHTSQKVQAFQDAVSSVVYDVLTSKVKYRLADVARLPEWSAKEEENVFELPSFSAYPLRYEAFSFGLLDLSRIASVAEGATQLYLEQLRAIPALSDRGAVQLSADIEYLCNVLSALSMSIPPPLSTLQACLMLPKDKLVAFASTQTPTSGPALADWAASTGIPENLVDVLDTQTARLVCKMRQVSFDS
ncbi:hypothetical protein CBR_g31542 [Chara braunii]|uniref:Conserved oligomeric Golgi complex subunit 7 n=1 Tax=Chara braunii TaxID=69332 RepID=A0A388LFB3_CHABU|nr:hypothetical protein CBR_g31542 [Chara braunii]|eukprot:GBG80986.1 hypothetical protein CBR_g31542 [Chara braunii]